MKNNVAKMYVLEFFISMYFFGAVLIPFFLDWGKISFVQVTFLQAWFVLCASLLEIPTGAVSDRFGRKRAIILGTIFWIAGVLIYASKPNFVVFFTGETVLALGTALLSGADSAIAYDSLRELGEEEKSKQMIGRLEGAGLLGMLLGAPLGSAIAHFLGLRATMLFMAFPISVALIIALTLKEPRVFAGGKKAGYGKIMAEGMEHCLRQGAVRLLIIDLILVGSPIFLMLWLYQLVLKEMGVPIGYFGVVQAAILIAEIICLTNIMRLEKLFRSGKKYLLASSILPGLALILLAFVHLLPLALIIIVFAVGFGLPRNALIVNYLHKQTSSEKRATVMSAINMLERGFQGICYVLIGPMVEWSLWWSIAGLGFFILTAAVVSPLRQKHLF